MKKRFPGLFVFSAGCLWGCMGILVKTMNEGGFTSIEVAAFRSFFTAVCMLAFLFLFHREKLHIAIRDVWCFIGTGLLSITFFNICYFYCMTITALSTAAILLYTAPAFVMVMSFFLFKEHFTGKKIVAVVLAFLGCVCVSGGLAGLQISIMGLLSGLGAGIGYALYSIFGRYAIKKGYDSLAITTYTFVFSAIGLAPMINWGHAMSCLEASASELPFLFAICALVTIAPYILYTRGLEGLENGKASILASVEPVVASLVGFLLYREGMQPIQVLGMVLVLLSCALAV